MKFSIYYKLLERDSYFDKFFKRERKKLSDESVALAEEMYRDLLELIASYILTNNKIALSVILTKQNSKIAKRFFDHFTNLGTTHMSKADILSCLDDFFEEGTHEEPK